MKQRLVILFLSFVLCGSITSQTYRTQALSKDIHTIMIRLNGDWQEFPIITLNSVNRIQLTFDRVSKNSFDRLRYKVIHCNADWTPSRLTEIEYINGFNDNPIDDYALSINTTVEYTNFRLEVPNRDINFKLSGNYVILVYEENNPRNILLSACFWVLDAQVRLEGNVTTNTLIDNNLAHQQIGFTINHLGMKIRDPFDELKVYVMQNDRLDNQKALVKPTFVRPNRITYEQNRDLIFEAGNEYRRFEAISHRFNGLHIERIVYERPYYFAYVFPDRARANMRYIYDQDQNGLFYIRNAEVNPNNADTEADYFFVRLTLKMEEPISDNVYVNGYFTNNTFNEKYLMQYDFLNREYFAVVYVKQGAYNYQYLTERNGQYSPAVIEGNYFETENQYQVFAYYRAMGERYDRLIGYLRLATNR